MTLLHHTAGLGRKTPVCAACLDQTRGLTTKLNVGYGQHVWLCAEHSSKEFRWQRDGQDFALALLSIWTAAGGLTRLRSLAIEAHLVRVERSLHPPDPRKPGSYSWPELRAEIDERLARGEDFEAIVAELRVRHATSDARLPSDRTFRRWRSDPRPPRTPAQRAGGDRPPRRPPRSLPPQRPAHQDDRTPSAPASLSPGAAPSPRSPRPPPARAGP